MRRLLAPAFLILLCAAAYGQTFIGSGTPTWGKDSTGKIGLRTGPNTFKTIGTLDPATLTWKAVVNFSDLLGSLACSQTPAETGDLTSPAGSCVNTLNTVNSNVGSFGGASSVPNLTVNGKGLVTAAGATAVVAPAGTLSGTALNSTVVNSSLATFAAGAAYGNLATNSIDPSKMSQAAAGTLRGNLTGGTANVSDSALTAYIDAAFGNTRGSILVRGASTWGLQAPSASGQVPTYNGTDTVFTAPGAITSPPQTPQGRLTLTSGAPILSAAVTSATIFYTPHTGAIIPLWNGTVFVPTQFSEVSQALSDATKSPTAAAAANVYDLFAWSDGGTFRVTRGPAWSAGATAGSNTARGQGAGSTQLTRAGGFLVNQFAITNGPAAGYGTYVGTIATDSGGATVSFNPGGLAAGGTAATVGLWNAFNRVLAGGSVRDNTASWTYATAAWRAPNGSATMRVTFVAGLVEDVWSARYSAIQTSSSTGYSSNGVGFDVTTTYTGSTGYLPQSSSGSPIGEAGVYALGQHFLSAIEYTNAGSMTATGLSGQLQSGLNWSGRF